MLHLTWSILFSYKNCSWWYIYLSTRSCWRRNCSLRNAWATRIHDIVDSAVSKHIGNAAHVLANILNSASRQCCNAWASQFPFLHNIHDTVPPSVACLYGHVNWSLTQGHQQFSLRLSQSLGLYMVFQNQTKGYVQVLMYRNYLSLVVSSWHKSLIWILWLKVIRVVGSQLGCMYEFHSHLKEGAPWGTVFWCVAINIFITIIFIYCAGWHTSKNVRSMEKVYFQ